MLTDLLLLALFLGIVVLLCWLGFKVSFPHQDPRSGRSDRHRTPRPPPVGDDESTRITPPAWPPLAL